MVLTSATRSSGWVLFSVTVAAETAVMTPARG